MAGRADRVRLSVPVGRAQSSEKVSPTAHYTGYVWARNGLSHPELSTRQGRVMYESLRPVMAISRALGGATLEPYLLARHPAIDVLLARAIEAGEVTQVLEVACGLSPRGWRFSRRYGDKLTYVEADLPEMAARKRQALQRMGALGEHHRVRSLDVLKHGGPDSLEAVAAELNPDEGLAILTEGLLNYLPRAAVDDIWHRFVRVLASFKHGSYLSDLDLGGVQSPAVRAFDLLLAAVVRGPVYLHFKTAAQAAAALRAAGFGAAEVHPATTVTAQARGAGSELAQILEASVSARPARS
jgi:O-methyltransferase involved in polyketide biosynthesis